MKEETDTENRAPPVPTLNTQRYLAMCEDFEISEAEKRELLQTLFSIMVSLVDLGLGLDPVQMLLKSSSELASSEVSDSLDCSLNPTIKACMRVFSGQSERSAQEDSNDETAQ